GSPHRLDLVALERKFQFMLVLHHISRKRDRQIVAQGLFTDGRSELQAVFLLKSTGISLAKEIPGVKDLEYQAVAFLSVFPHKGLGILKAWGLNGLEAELLKLLLNIPDNIG